MQVKVGDWSFESRYFTTCRKGLDGAVERLGALERASEEAELREKEVYAELLDYLARKAEKKEQSGATCKAFKKEFEQRIKELSGR